MLSRAKVLSFALVGAISGGAVLALTAGAAAADEAVVSRIIDGDTVDVRLDGHIERIRLLNIDTPETKDPDEPVECLGPEASAHLAKLIPVGTTVTLEYDEEPTDRYGRTLAAVFGADGTLVNAEMSRAGLARAVSYGENDHFLKAVQDAQEEAASQKRGLYSADLACTIPSQVQAVTEQASVAQPQSAAMAQMSSAELEAATAKAATAAAAASALVEAFETDHRALVWAALSPRQLERLLDRASDASQRASAAHTALSGELDRARAREAEAARVAAEAEAARVAAEQAARAAAEAQAAALAEQQRAAEQERARRPQPSSPSRSKAPAGKSTPAPAPAPGSSDPYPGYTGPRCYAPGGKTWKPCP